MAGLCEGKVAIVTGAAGEGMGRSIALTLAREGAKVVVNYRSSEESAYAIVDSINSSGGSAIAVQADIFEAAECKRLAETTIQHFGGVDICVVGPGGIFNVDPLEHMEPSVAFESLHREVAPLFHLMQVVLPAMYQRGWGRFIGIALNPTKLPPSYIYNVGKAARVQALLLAGDETWAKGVTVNIIAPGPVGKIGNLQEAIDQCNHTESWSHRTNISPQDIAEGVTFLCSEAGRYITGCILPYLFKGE